MFIDQLGILGSHYPHQERWADMFRLPRHVCTMHGGHR